jgi:hypothetical protein
MGKMKAEKHSSAPARDPRIDPLPGDSVSREFKTATGGCIIREVTRSHGGFVFFERDNGHRTSPKIEALAQWRTWCRKAEVLEVATLNGARAALRKADGAA